MNRPSHPNLKATHRWQTALACTLVAGLALAAFWPVLDHGFIEYDDPGYVTENQRVQSGLNWAGVRWAFSTGAEGNWHPVTWLSHQLDVECFGLAPHGHHLTNLLIHTLNSMLLLLLLRRMTGSLGRSAMVAALFATHPLHVESVAWVAERKDVLSTFFFLLTLMAYARCADGSPGGKRTGVGWFWYGAALVCLALGLMSKPMLVTVPFVLLLLDGWPLRRIAEAPARGPASPWKRLLLEKVPFLALAIGSSVITLWVQHAGGTVATVQGLSLTTRIANAMAACLKYLGKAVWPVDLAIFYPHPALTLGPSGAWVMGWLVCGSLVLLLISAAAWRMRRQQPWLFTGWFWYLGTLIPVIGLVQVGSQSMADRYTYIPLIGVFLAVVWGVGDFLNRRSGRLALAATVGSVLLLACFWLTRNQLRYWRDDTALFEHALAVNERNAPAHAILATVLGRQGKLESALTHARAATEADPAHAPGWHVSGDVYDALRQPQEAVRCYDVALRWNPRSSQTWFRLACVQAALGQTDAAIKSYRSALELKPDFAAAWNNLATTLWGIGKRTEAIEAFTRAARLNPSAADKRLNLANALAEEGRWSEAIHELIATRQLQPDNTDARLLLGHALARAGRFDEAQAELRTLVTLNPTNPAPHLALGTVLLLAGRTDETTTAFAEARRRRPSLAAEALTAGNSFVARGDLEAAIRSYNTVLSLEPDSAEAHERLGLVLAVRGQLDAAADHLRQCVRLSPGAGSHYNLARVQAMQGRRSEAIANCREAIRLNADFAAALNDLAWMLATAPEARLRNGAEAVLLAGRACQLTGNRNARYLGTLDAAYGEAGSFSEAIAAAGRTRDLASANGDKSVADAAEARIARYREGQPFHQPDPMAETQPATSGPR